MATSLPIAPGSLTKLIGGLLVSNCLLYTSCKKEPTLSAPTINVIPPKNSEPVDVTPKDVREKYVGRFRIKYLSMGGGRSLPTTTYTITGIGEFYYNPTDSLRYGLTNRMYPLIKLRSISGLDDIRYKEFGIDKDGRLRFVSPWGTGGFVSADSLNFNNETSKVASTWEQQVYTGTRIK